jgi:uncharacterized Zn finger protein (UPF0148 family)
VKTRETFVPWQIRRLAETYRFGAAWLDTCPACGIRYMRAPDGKAYAKPCPSCDECLRAMGAIGIDVAVGLIAARRAA